MFVGHYGVSFAVKRRDTTLPLWVLFLAVQLLDVAWAPFFLVHRPDLPLYDDAAKVGLGLWNVPALAYGLEAVLLLGGITLCMQAQLVRGRLTIVFGVVMLAIQAYVFFGPPPVSGSAAALTALVSYALFAGVIHLLERKRGLSAGTA